MNTQPSQSGIFPRFYMEAKQSKALTEESGYPRFIDQEMVEIRIAGDSKTVVVKKVTDEHRMRWPQHYEAFKKGLSAPMEGFPLKHCPLFTVSEVQTLNAQSIYTVEALAELPDSFIARLGMGARGWVAKAKAFLKSAQGSAEATKQAAENERLQLEIEMLKQQIKELGSKPMIQGTEIKYTLENANTGDSINDDYDVEVPDTFAEMKLSNRTANALKKAGVWTPADLLKLTAEELADLPGLGVSAIDEITGLMQ